MTYNVILINFSLINEKSDGGNKIKILCYPGILAEASLIRS